MMLIKMCMALGIRLQNRRTVAWWKEMKEDRQRKAKALVSGGTVRLA